MTVGISLSQSIRKPEIPRAPQHQQNRSPCPGIDRNQGGATNQSGQ
jgi:hypothetical protein